MEAHSSNRLCQSRRNRSPNTRDRPRGDLAGGVVQRQPGRRPPRVPRAGRRSLGAMLPAYAATRRRSPTRARTARAPGCPPASGRARPAKQADVAVEHHRRPRQDEEVVAVEMQVAHAQTTELQEVLAQHRAVSPAAPGAANRRRPRPRPRAAPSSHAAPGRAVPAAVAMPTNASPRCRSRCPCREWPGTAEVRIVLQQPGQQVVLGVTLQPHRAPPVRRPRERAGVRRRCRSIGRRASRRRLPSSASLVRRLACSASSLSGLAFLRLRPCDPTSHSQPSPPPSPRGRLRRRPLRKVEHHRAGKTAGRRSAASRVPPERGAAAVLARASSPATHNQSPVKATPDRLMRARLGGQNSSRTAFSWRVLGMEDSERRATSTFFRRLVTVRVRVGEIQRTDLAEHERIGSDQIYHPMMPGTSRAARGGPEAEASTERSTTGFGAVARRCARRSSTHRAGLRNARHRFRPPGLRVARRVPATRSTALPLALSPSTNGCAPSPGSGSVAIDPRQPITARSTHPPATAATENNRHSPGTPLKTCTPRSSN